MSILDKFSLSDRVIVVTGASAGIGRGIALACAEAGAIVIAIGRNRDNLDSLQNEILQKGQKCFCKTLDITDFKKIPFTISEIVQAHGKISGMVHAAGMALSCPIRVITPETYQQIYSVNVIAGFELAKVISQSRHIADQASFLYIASVSGIKGEAGLLAYSSSKGAVLAGVRSMAVELSSKQIRVNALIPGLIADTEMGQAMLQELPDQAMIRLQEKHLLGFGNVQSLTATVVFFLSPASSWITGSTLVIDGGYCL